MELKVTYKKKDRIDENMDQKIERALELLGFKWRGSRHDLITGIRVITFDDEK